MGLPERTPDEKKQIRGETMHVGDAMDALHGVMQGWLDPIEGLTQLAERSTGWHLAPEGLRSWARDYRKRAQSTYAGQAGELAGNIFNPVMLVPGGALARGAGALASRVPGAARAASAALARPGLVRAAEGGIGGAAGAAAQPVSGGGDYWRAKGDQAAAGFLGGATLPALAAQAQRVSPWVQQNLGSHAWPVRLAHLAAGPAAAGVSAAGRQAGRLSAGQTGRMIGDVQGQAPPEEDE
jgi:hypothetical protein